MNVGLQLVVQRQLDVGARGALVALKLAHDAAGGVDLDPLGAGLAAQLVLALGLQPDLADLEARDQQQPVRGIYPLKVMVADRADIADDMGIGPRHAGNGA